MQSNQKFFIKKCEWLKRNPHTNRYTLSALPFTTAIARMDDITQPTNDVENH